MKTDDLVHMANQIGYYYQAYELDEAVTGIYSHVLRFWHPELRAQLLALALNTSSSATCALLANVRAAALRLPRSTL